MYVCVYTVQRNFKCVVILLNYCLIIFRHYSIHHDGDGNGNQLLISSTPNYSRFKKPEISMDSVLEKIRKQQGARQVWTPEKLKELTKPKI
jgi:hypothetical protein